MTSPKEAHRLLLRSAALICSVYFSMPVAALSLGAEQVTSTLGQPLRMVVQLLGESAASLETRCFRVVPPAKSDGLYVVTQARIELQNSSTPPQLIVRGNQSIDEPIVRISIEAGCDAPIRREYTLLLDPPTLQAIDPRVPSARLNVTPAQSVAASTELTAGSLATADAASVAPRTPSSANSRAAQRAGNSNAAARQKSVAAVKIDKKSAASRRTDSPMPPAATAATRPALQDQLQVRTSEQNSGARVDEAALAALAVPRLRVSSDLALIDPANAPGLAVTDELQAAINKDRRARLLAAPIDSDLAPRLEADLVVAQRRLAELQSQLAAAGIAVNVANKVPERSAVVNSKTPISPALGAASGWDWRNWLWIPGVLLIVALIAFLLRQRRGSTNSQFDAHLNEPTAYANDDEASAVRAIVDGGSPASDPGKSASTRSTYAVPLANAANTANAANALGTASTSEPVIQPTTRKANPASPIIATKAEREASDRLNNPLFQLRDTESHVDVTVLSQVTEEAQVYAELGRNDQAIALLRDHIDGQQGDKSSPAPWLMIFELYRKTNDRRGYDELAPQFRKHFNGRVPDWDNYGHELALDDGLEAFPHLVARIERDWGTSDARKFLEELLYDNRGGSRLGFSLAAYRDILLLLQVHEGLATEPELPASDWESRGANDRDGTPKWDLSLEMIEPPKHGELASFLNGRPPERA